MQLTTIGFTRSSARSFFERLQSARVARVLDVRLNNTSQLAGFAKRADLIYLLDAIAGIGYVHVTELAPTPDLLTAYRRRELGWDAYAAAYLELLRARDVQARLDPAIFDGACLLCSEPTPHHCHRRLAAEYLSTHWPGIELRHL